MKIALYTVNIGGYDQIIESDKIDGVDMFMITDMPYDGSAWNIIRPMFRAESDMKTSRHPKINSHLFFPDYDYTIYIDSNMFINMHPRFFIENFLSNTDIALHKNPYRSCLYEEANEVIRLKYENPDIVNAQVEYIRKEKYPEKNGLGACHLLVRRNTSHISQLNEMWWSMVSRFSYRDQLSFDYSCWKTYNTYKIIEPYKKYILEVPHKKKKVIFK